MNGMANVYEPGVCPICGGRNGIHIWAGSGICPNAIGSIGIPSDQQKEIERLTYEMEKLRSQGQQEQDGRKEAQAEIERLNNVIRATEAERDAGDKVANNLRKLITELAGKLDKLRSSFDFISESVWEAYEVPQLVERAREAAK